MAKHVSIEGKVYGAEPKFDSNVTLTRADVIQALNWYHQMVDAKDGKAFLLKEIKGKPKELLDKISKLPDEKVASVGFIARMISRGAVLPEQEFASYSKALTFVIDTAREGGSPGCPITVGGDEHHKVSVQDRIRVQADNVIAQFEEVLDLKEYDVDVENIIQYHNIKAPHARHIVEWCGLHLREFREVLVTKDADLKEGYSNYSKKEMKQVIDFLSKIEDTANKVLFVAKAQRKPRKKKVKAASEIVGSVKYRKADDELKIVSIDPSQIVGASQLWVFNTKTRKLGVFYAADADGLSVKGTTVKNFDESKSKQRHVRKPEVLAGNIAIPTLRKFMDVKGKFFPLTGRLNEDILLLKVIK